MKAWVSKTVTMILMRLPVFARAALLRKAIAIADDETRFQNWQITMFGSLANLRKAGFSPGGVIDIGANVGAWTRRTAGIFPGAQFHMMEAQPALVGDLEQVATALGDRATFEIGLLGAATQDAVPFYLLGTGSSVLEEVTDLHKEVVTLSMRRLDDVVRVRKLPKPLFLKLDVQGYELEVLKGAPEILAETEVVLLEVSLLPYNTGAPLMPEVIAFMAERGFVPYDLCGQQRRVSDRAMFQVDMIFVRTDSALRAHRRFSTLEPNRAEGPAV